MEYEESSDVEMIPIEEMNKAKNPLKTEIQVKIYL